MRWVAAAIVLSIGLCLWLTPLLSRRTVPLGVSVPSDRVEDPVVRAAILRFRQTVGVGTVLVAVAVLLLGGSDPVVSIAPLVVVVLAVAAFVWARQSILQAKAREGWYDKVPVRLRATATSSADRAPWTARVEIGWYVASAVLLLATAIVGVTQYDNLPDRIPTHFSLSGQPDQYSDKTMLSLFGPLLVGAGLIVLFLGLMGLTFLTPERQYADGDPARAGGVARRKRAFVARLLGVLAVVICAMICGACLAIFFQTTSWALTPVLVGGLVLIGAAVVWAIVRTIQLQRPPTDPPESTDAAMESPDDDRFWKAGMLYVNAGDPALFVPKRQGIGYTINLGHRVGQIITAIFLLVIVVSIVSSAVGSG